MNIASIQTSRPRIQAPRFGNQANSHVDQVKAELLQIFQAHQIEFDSVNTNGNTLYFVPKEYEDEEKALKLIQSLPDNGRADNEITLFGQKHLLKDHPAYKGVGYTIFKPRGMGALISKP